jgi:hypothetical protein
MLCIVKYQINGDSVQIPLNQCKICWPHHMYAIIKEYELITTKFMYAFYMHHLPLKYYIQHPSQIFLQLWKCCRPLKHLPINVVSLIYFTPSTSTRSFKVPLDFFHIHSQIPWPPYVSHETQTYLFPTTSANSLTQWNGRNFTVAETMSYCSIGLHCPCHTPPSLSTGHPWQHLKIAKGFVEPVPTKFHMEKM